jgi:NADH dehydrogenase FAD-containing subunit
LTRLIDLPRQIFATGQKPNSALYGDYSCRETYSPLFRIGKLSPASLNPQGFVKVKRCLQIEDPALPNVFAVGDVIDGFGAIKAGHTGWQQASIAAENVVKDINAKLAGSGTPTFDEYYPGKPQIKLSLGLVRAGEGG